MTDSDDIIVLDPDDMEYDLESSSELDAQGEPARRSIPIWIFALIGGFFLGVSVALAAAWYLQPKPFDPAPLQAEIQSLKTDLAALEARPAPAVPQVDLGPITRRIRALEARPTVDPLSEDIVARMEALQADGFELPDIPDVSGLETKLIQLEQSLSALEQKVDARPPVLQSTTKTESFVDPATLPRFPAATLREGAAQMGGSGFFRRTLSQHVRVRGRDNPDRLISEVEAHLAAGRPHAALKSFDQLPSQLRTLAQAWRADMEAALQ